MPSWRDRVYVPCVQQKHVMCALAVAGNMVTWMIYFSAHSVLQETLNIGHQLPIGEHVQDLVGNHHGRCFNQLPVPLTYSDMDLPKCGPRCLWPRLMSLGTIYVFWLFVSVAGVCSGMMVDQLGPRYFWGLGSLPGVVMALGVCFSSQLGPVLLFVCVAVGGFCCGLHWPSYTAVVAYWAPQNERTTFVALVESATYFGLMVNFIMHSNFEVVSWYRWLVVSSVAGVAWVFVWHVLFYNRPWEHPHIPSNELRDLVKRVSGIPSPDRPTRCKPAVPWRAIFLSPPFLSLLSLSVAATWVQSLVAYHMNRYLARVLNVTSILVEGVQSSGLALGAAAGSVLVHGWVSDKLMSSGLTSRTANRRLLLVLPCYASAALLVAIPWLACSTTWVVVAFFLIIHFQGIAFTPMITNVVDLSPRHAGLLCGLQITCRAFASVFCRNLVGVVVDDSAAYSSWAPVFRASAAVAVVLPLPYLWLGSGEIQSWNYYPPDEPVGEVPVSVTLRDEVEIHDIHDAPATSEPMKKQ